LATPDRGERAWLSLGGNIGNPAEAMGTALRLLDAEPDTKVVAVSSLYKTPPWGKTDQPDFINAAAGVETSLSPRGLLERCLDAERRLKRVRQERWGPRVLDMDILLFGNWRIVEEGLVIPHPRMLERAFVLVPLAEIAPNLVLEGAAVSARAERIDSAGIVRLPTRRDWWKQPRD
jgi:2-amino-4-hydroxy-6-hydroxymethyldihydropteridine diphosphokinase